MADLASSTGAVETCPRCATPLSPGTSSCSRCHLALRCPACGTDYRDPKNDRFCADCGQRVVRQERDYLRRDTTSPLGPQPAEPSSGVRSALAATARGVAEAAIGQLGRLDE